MLVAGLALAVVSWLPVRRWFSRWGTTPEELARVMPGDALLPDATEMSMQAITVNHPDFGSAWRQRDLDFVTSREFRELLKAHDIKLVSWDQIRRVM